MLISISKGNSLKTFEPINTNENNKLSSIVLNSIWSPGVYEGNHRKIENFKEASCLGLDIDGGCSLDTAIELFRPYKHIIGTTRNHQKEKNGEVCDRFRVILLFEHPVTDSQVFTNTWHVLYKKFPFIDEKAKDPSRLYYPCTDIVSVNAHGNFIEPVLELPQEKEIIKSHLDQKAAINKGHLSRSTLEFIFMGAAPGSRNDSLFKAAKDMQEQGYEEGEAIETLAPIVVSPDFTEQEATNSIKSAFASAPKYSQRKFSGEEVISAAELAKESWDYLNDDSKVKGQPTGFTSLDKLLGGGFRQGEITALHAEAKTGKSSFFHHVIYKMCQMGCSIGYASREMRPSTEVIPNIQSIAFNKNMFKKESIKSIEEEQWIREVSTLNIFFAPGYGLFELFELKNWIRSLKSLGVKYVFIDHLHFMLANPEDHAEASRLVKELKTLAQDEEVSIFIIIQPNKLMEGQSLGKNTVKGGSAISQGIDNLILMEKTDTKDVRRLKLDFGRHKLCKSGHFYVKYDSDTMKFDEVDVIEDGGQEEIFSTQGYGNKKSFSQSASAFIKSKVVNNNLR